MAEQFKFGDIGRHHACTTRYGDSVFSVVRAQARQIQVSCLCNIEMRTHLTIDKTACMKCFLFFQIHFYF